MSRQIRDQVAGGFGKALREARARAGKSMTRERLAELSTVSVPAIARYESGKRAPGLVEALLLAKALRFSLDDVA